ncbi:MAG: DUF5372 family protein [Candidatus Binataceae bacterium]
MSFEITHPFHPKRGARWVLRTRQLNWGEDRVVYFDAKGRLRSMPTSWTSVGQQDAFMQASVGRSWFRPDDLLRLGALLSEVTRGTSP